MRCAKDGFRCEMQSVRAHERACMQDRHGCGSIRANLEVALVGYLKGSQQIACKISRPEDPQRSADEHTFSHARISRCDMLFCLSPHVKYGQEMGRRRLVHGAAGRTSLSEKECTRAICTSTQMSTFSVFHPHSLSISRLVCICASKAATSDDSVTLSTRHSTQRRSARVSETFLAL